MAIEASNSEKLEKEELLSEIQNMKDWNEKMLQIIRDMNHQQTIGFGEIEAVALMVLEACQSDKFDNISHHLFGVMNNISHTASSYSNDISSLAENYSLPAPNKCSVRNIKEELPF